MKFRTTLIILSATLLINVTGLAFAANDEKNAANEADAAEQVRLEAEYKRALESANQQQAEARVAMEKAREQLHLAKEQRKKTSVDQAEARSVQQQEMKKMQQQLNQVRRQLRETSREIARVNRDVARARMVDEQANFVFASSSRPVLGIILGESTDVGIKVLGVSPDGPSERAGIEAGDVIIAMGGRVLSAVGESGNVREGLNIAIQDIKVDVPVILSVERNDLTLDLIVVPEVREPLAWQSTIRFTTAPTVPSAVAKTLLIERIIVPEINTVALAEQIAKIRVEVDKRRVLIESGSLAPHSDGHGGEWEIEFHELSEMGDFALHDVNMWFGLPLADGLKLAAIDPDLGEYFKTDRGVLVLKAKPDNGLQLETGDVILQVGDTEVHSPADFMRALRNYEPGESLEVEIKRKRKDKTLKMVMPDRQSRSFAPQSSDKLSFSYSIN